MTLSTLRRGLAALAFTAATIPLLASALANGKSGARTITLSNEVGANQIRFLSTAPLEEIKGTGALSGSFTIDPANLEATKGTLTTPIASMRTGNSKRDEHMQGDDWLGMAKNPNITFTVKRLTGVKTAGDAAKSIANGTAVGDFSLNGVTREVSAPVTITWIAENAETKKRAAGDLVHVKATFTVSLKDFKVAGRGGMVGSKVGETISIEANLYGATK